MKIDEAVDIINGTTTVKAKYDNHSIFVCFKSVSYTHLTLPTNIRV